MVRTKPLAVSEIPFAVLSVSDLAFIRQFIDTGMLLADVTILKSSDINADQNIAVVLGRR